MMRWILYLAALLVMQPLGSCCLCEREALPSGTTLLAHFERERLPDSIWLVRTRGPCPKAVSEAGVWHYRKLFSLPSENGDQTYCQYVWRSESGGAPDLQVLSKPGVELVDDPPLVAVATARELPRDPSWEHQLTRERLDFAAPTEERRKLARGNVRVAVLDTAVRTPLGKLHDPVGHGTAVGALIDEVACDGDPSCDVELEYYPALPYTGDKGDLVMSDTGAGGLGTGATLAAQIVLATRAWAMPDGNRDNDQAPRAPLVINISLGWSGCYKDLSSLASEAAHRAIEYATCQGAIVVASAGNADVIPGCPEKPAPKPGAKPLHMFPGLWANEHISAKTCSSKNIPSRIDDRTRPLLFGVGAIDRHDEALSITDHGSDFVAYGQSVTVEVSRGKWAQLTGTSMSAAAASGMIARALRHQPQLTASEMFDVLRRTAVTLGTLRKDQDGFICHQRNDAGECGVVSVHRLSLCGILREFANVDCKKLEPKAPIRVPGEAPPIESSTLLAATPCSACVDDACRTTCNRPAGAGDLDARDLPWAQPQPPPSGPENASNRIVAQYLYAGVTHTPYAIAMFSRRAPSEYLLELTLQSDVRAMLLIVTPEQTPMAVSRTLSFALGDAKKREMRQYIVRTPTPVTAKVTYQLADGSYEVSDVVVGSRPRSLQALQPASASQVR